jgi:hypothetical protein
MAVEDIAAVPKSADCNIAVIIAPSPVRPTPKWPFLMRQQVADIDYGGLAPVLAIRAAATAARV